MAKTNDPGQYPLKLHQRYRLIQGIAGLAAGEVIRVAHLRGQTLPEGPRDIYITIERPDGRQKEIKLNMGPGMARSYFEPLSGS